MLDGGWPARQVPVGVEIRNLKRHYPVIGARADAGLDDHARTDSHRWRSHCRYRLVRAAQMAEAAARDTREGTVLEMLGRRYARGEIDRAEYLQKRSDILGYPGMPSRP
jgi:putative oligomerization/nucleic acid binding protein